MECEKIEMAQKTKNILNSNKHIRNSSVNQILPLNSDVQTVADDLDSAKQQQRNKPYIIRPFICYITQFETNFMQFIKDQEQADLFL